MIVLGIDPSMSNFGLAKGVFKDTLSITDTHVIRSKEVIKVKGDYKNEHDIAIAKNIYQQLSPWLKDVDIVCIEVPVGSQSARAMVSYGICVALIATICAKHHHVIRITPNQVKQKVGNKKATKDDVIAWVKDKHPEYTLPKAKCVAEHIADAIVTLHVGLDGE